MVSQKYSIWVDHRYDIKVIVVSQKWGLQHPWDKTLKCKIGDSFTRMGPCQHYYGLFVIMTMKSFLMGLSVHSFTFFFLLSLMELMWFSAYYTYRHDIETWQTGSHSLDWNFLFVGYALKIIIHSGAGIRRQCGKICLFILLKLILKFEKEALLLRVILIDHFLPLLAPLAVSSLDEGLHSYSI